MLSIDKLCYQSALRYANAAEKFVYAVLTLCICVAGRSWTAAVFAFAANGVLTVWKGKIPLLRYLRLLLVPAVFLIVGTAAVIVNLSRSPMDAFALSVGEWYLTGSRASILWGLNLCATAFASVSCLYFLSLNTTMTDILGVLRRMHLPSLLIELMMLIYRFLFILLETASAIMTAQESRLGNRNFAVRVRSFGGMASALFIRAMKRANALYDAMESRCYDGELRVLAEEHPARKREIAGIAAFETILIALTVLT